MKGASSMSSEKDLGMDVHQATISVAVMDSDGKTLTMESFSTTTINHIAYQKIPCC
jgi:hypothetical protein